MLSWRGGLITLDAMLITAPDMLISGRQEVEKCSASRSTSTSD